jgi:Uma2 family endonuclease
MSNPGFSDRAQEPFGDIPTEPEAFLLWSSQRKREEGKFELSHGRVIRTMINASRNHARVCKNLLIELARLLDPERFDVSAADFAVRTPMGLRSPDIVVDLVAPGRSLVTTAPLFITEVLSPSTTGVDFTEKLEEYRAVESLQAYLICAQDEPRAWLWARQSNNGWPSRPEELVGRDSSIPLAGLGIALSMAAIFRGIPDAPTLG